MELRPGQVAIWQIDLHAFQEPSRLPAYLELLDSEEQARYRRLAFEPLRQNYLVAHALTRLILARYEGVAPAAVSFTRNAFGRPELHDSPCELRFSLSHARAFAALAITTTWDIGLDLECDDRPVSPLAIAERYFAPAEVAWLRALPLEGLKSAFVDLWTLKEAYIKARGLGLSMALDEFAIDLSNPGQPHLVFSAQSDDDPSEWKLFLSRPMAGCARSLAIHCGASTEPDLTTFEVASPGIELTISWL